MLYRRLFMKKGLLIFPRFLTQKQNLNSSHLRDGSWFGVVIKAWMHAWKLEGHEKCVRVARGDGRVHLQIFQCSSHLAKCIYNLMEHAKPCINHKNTTRLYSIQNITKYSILPLSVQLQMHRGRHNEVRTTMTHSTSSRGPRFCSYHVVTSSVHI